MQYESKHTIILQTYQAQKETTGKSEMTEKCNTMYYSSVNKISRVAHFILHKTG